MQCNTSKNKLIVLLNLSGSYKGGAQRRYLALFNYLQRTNQNEYFLLLNESLYNACFNDAILTDTKNVICVLVKYGEKIHLKTENTLLKINVNPTPPTVPKQRSRLYNFLGSLSSFLKQFRGWASYSLQLIKIVKKFNIGVIYGVFTGGIWSWQIARILNIKFIYSYNDASASMIESSILKIFNSEYYPLKFADQVDFLSEGILNKLKEKGVNFSKNKVLITPNSFIHYKNFKPEYPKKNLITFLARMDLSINGISLKNPELLLEAIDLLQQRGKNTHRYIFIGEGELLNNLKNRAQVLKLENVEFVGGVSKPENILKHSSIFVSIQTDNNYPSQSLLEAMACENAIIASDVGETRELVTESEGILVPLIAEKIADAIQFLLANPSECERLGKNARKKVLSEQTIEKFVDYFFEITKC